MEIAIEVRSGTGEYRNTRLIFVSSRNMNEIIYVPGNRMEIYDGSKHENYSSRDFYFRRIHQQLYILRPRRK
jgi:hypothetical protein